MTNLSPAAQAVRDAVLATYADSIPKDDNLWKLERASTAAALRAVADQVVPQCGSFLMTASEDRVRHQLLAIAAELEAIHD
jgi:hypothetical protein